MSPAPTLRFSALRTRLAAWWREPRLTWWVLALLLALIALRKPSALHTPQFWAEDGSVFLIENDQLGLAALLQPYMGYLHTLPRITAWLASALLDPAWWPACYNGVAFALWVTVIARTFSPRLPLPHKPWLALAMFLGPQTGEILLNLTNVQWITAFVLVQQALIARPVTWGQRAGDLAVLAAVGLTGPFVVALVPLLAWRWWRDRHVDNLAVLLVAAACAGVQGWLIHRANITFEHQQAPLQVFSALTVLSRRLLFWPVFGAKVTYAIPDVLLGTLGTAVLGALFAWALRPHPRRLLRTQILAACALLMLAGFVRMRPDTWTGDDLAFSDRYFFLPRVLLAWLIVLEIDAVPRAVAWAARAAALGIALVHLPDYRLPDPPDFHWKEKCDPIRRGVPARIPILPEDWILDYPGRPPGRHP